MFGYVDGTFKPNENLIRSEAVTVINRMLYRGPINDGKQIFTDMAQSNWYFGQVEEASYSHKYIINPDNSETVKLWVEDEIK